MATGGEQDLTRLVNDDAYISGKVPDMCGLCKTKHTKKPAAAVCSTCDVKLCLECCPGHQQFATGEHVILSLDDEVMETVLIDIKGLDRCLDHDQVICFFCKDHESLCCNDCLLESHGNCIKNVCKLKDMTADANRSLTGSIEEVQKVIFDTRNMIDDCDMKVRGNDKRRNGIMREIDRRTKEIIQRINDETKRIGENLDEHISSERTRLDDVKHEAKSVKKNLQKLMSLYEVVSKDGTDDIKFILHIRCKRDTTLATSTLNNLQKHNYTVPHTIEWNNHLLSIMNEQLLSLRQIPYISDMETADNVDHDVGRNIHFVLRCLLSSLILYIEAICFTNTL